MLDFLYTLQWAGMCPQNCLSHGGDLGFLVPWTHPTRHPEWHLTRFSYLSTAYHVTNKHRHT